MEVQDEGGQSALHQPQDLFLMQETEVDSKTWLCAPKSILKLYTLISLRASYPISEMTHTSSATLASYGSPRVL